MATLVSPGVSVTVTDESAYASAGIGTIPLIVIGTAANKYASGSTTSYAPGTTSANANKLWLITSQRDLLQTFGAPKFYTAAGSPQYDNELNELGLFTAYQYLGIANTAYVLRADLDMGQLAPTTTEPKGPSIAGQYWLDTTHTTWGVFQSNGNVNSALSWVAKTPTVITSAAQLEIITQSAMITTDASAALITMSSDLVINGLLVPLTMDMSLSDVASAINGNEHVRAAGITAQIYARTGKPDVNVSAISDMYYLRLISTALPLEIDLAGTDSQILTDLMFDPSPENYYVPAHAFGSANHYVVDAYSVDLVDGTKKNSLWEKLVQTTLDGATKEWWFKVGTNETMLPGWGWREAKPRVITGTVVNPVFSTGTECTISIGDSTPVTITVTGTDIATFVSDLNSIFDANSFNVYASIKRNGNKKYVVVTNYDGTNTQFNDLSLEDATTHPWRDAGILPTQTYYGSVTGTLASPTFTAATKLVSQGSVSSAGTGYLVGDFLTVVGGTHSVAGVLEVTAIQAVLAASNNAGTGYQVGDNLVFSGVDYTTPVVLTVNSVGAGGDILGVDITTPGQFTGAVPANPVTPTSTDSAGGQDATFDITWGVGTTSVANGGVYTVDPVGTVSVTGGSGTAATFDLIMGFLTADTFTIDPGNGVAVTVYVPAAPYNTLSGVVNAINAAFPSGPIVASASSNKLKITNTNGTQFTVEDVSGTPLGGAGIDVGYRYGRKLVYQGFYPSLTVPSNLSQLAIDNVWINTTPADRGANLVIKRYSGIDWVQQNVTPASGTVPMYSTDSAANAAFGGSKAIGSIYARYNSDGDNPPAANMVIYHWDGTSWQPLNYTASATAPKSKPADGTLWFNPNLKVDIMVGNGQIWQGYKNRYPATDANGPIIDGSMPITQSNGAPLTDNDIWIDSSVTPYPVIYRYDGAAGAWNLVDNTNHSSPAGIIFSDARYTSNGLFSGSDEIQHMITSDYVDGDVPNAELYPSGMLLFNTRYSTYNVKEYMVNYFPDAVGTENDAWVTFSGNAPDGTPYMGSAAQRACVVRGLRAALESNQDIRAEATNFNLMACPGYAEVLADMVTLNTDRKETSFIVADVPKELSSDGTSIQNWANNYANAAEDGIDGLVTHSPYAAIYYPWGLATNLDGNHVLVPASEMALRTYAYNDQVAYPWFAPAGFHRGLVTGASSVGYLKGDGTYQPVVLGQGQRDTLYLNNINPIAYIPGRGLVVYGQKTLNPIATALDRVNVARLIVYLKYQLDILAKPFLFEPNDAQTRSAVVVVFNGFMGQLVGLRAIYDFAVVCDETNNTPARIDANELWIDVAIKPEKAIEFIYIPIRILNTGDPLPGSNNNTITYG